MYQNILLLLVGLFILILGGDFLVKGASSFALRFNISPMVVGLTIVAFGTSAPELLISISAALSGSPDMTMGNIVGSNICNLGLVLGVTALISPIYVGKTSLKLDWPMTMGSSLALFFIAQSGSINYVFGISFVLVLVTYVVYLIVKSKSQTEFVVAIDDDIPSAPSSSQLKDVTFMAVGCAGLYFGADWFVGGAQHLAALLGVSERIIGITVLALGTSLPELTTAVIASIKKETDLALGNLLGSNIFNVLSILGITSIIKEIQVNPLIVRLDMPWMLGITFIILPFMFTGKHIERWEGIILLLVYGIYTYSVIV
ncbi:MAG: calcium/sodium antiporter [Bacteroidota bacterium]